jgi:hypothetical protein
MILSRSRFLQKQEKNVLRNVFVSTGVYERAGEESRTDGCTLEMATAL